MSGHFFVCVWKGGWEGEGFEICRKRPKIFVLIALWLDIFVRGQTFLSGHFFVPQSHVPKHMRRLVYVCLVQKENSGILSTCSHPPAHTCGAVKNLKIEVSSGHPLGVIPYEKLSNRFSGCNTSEWKSRGRIILMVHVFSLLMTF